MMQFGPSQGMILATPGTVAFTMAIQGIVHLNMCDSHGMEVYLFTAECLRCERSKEMGKGWFCGQCLANPRRQEE